ncbi:hypothetical protein AB6A40_001775 [Gnathostoma spinigerum]|uniref:Uncharacterized protein n=1 Tax=Gnathostoma spinigerum TaxID=75299 RepID=A0ABD6E683_9BILA
MSAIMARIWQPRNNLPDRFQVVRHVLVRVLQFESCRTVLDRCGSSVMALPMSVATIAISNHRSCWERSVDKGKLSLKVKLSSMLHQLNREKITRFLQRLTEKENKASKRRGESVIE